MPSSLAPVPREPRKPPTTRIFQPDEIQSFQSKFYISSFSDAVNYIKQSEEYRDFQVYTSADSITSYRVAICSEIAIVKECIHIDSNLTIKLSYEGCNIPLPSYIARAEGSKLTSLGMLTNLPVYCKDAEGTTITSPESDEDSVILHSFIHEINNEDTINHITISQNAVEVITYLSGYISHSLLKSIDCEECKIALK